MKISVNWLKEFIEIDKTPRDLDHLLTMSGLEVEGIELYETVKGGLKGMVTGEVLECAKHPNADKLSITKVDIGADEPSPIVCGAPNVATGQKVVVATVGATLYPAGGEPFTIKKAKIRGQVSEGMICAEDELGLGKSHEGIMVLDTNLPNGTPASEYFRISTDHVLEIGLTPNRADAASHYGVARDLKLLLGKPICFPDTSISVDNENLPIEVAVENPEACPRYAGITLTGVKVQESPQWLKDRLKAIGLEPRNNVVDITNYVLHGLGQPLHAFDADKITGRKIVVKTGCGGQKFTTLDGISRNLLQDDLMICDAEKPMCIAGVFGGAESGVTGATTSVFIESAYFEPGYIRRTSMAHTLKTDAAFRFERGVDPDMTLPALKLAARLIKEVAGGSISSQIVDVYPEPVKPFPVNIKYKNVDRLVGKQIPHSQIKEILQSLDIKIVSETEEGLSLQVPPYRVDVQREADVIEDILRIYGYNNVETSDYLSTGFLASFPEKDPDELQQKVGALLAGDGFQEIMTNSISSSAYARHMGTEEGMVKLLNPLSSDLDIMRQRMLFTGLEVVKHNLNRRQSDLRLYELGKTYSQEGGAYHEQKWLAFYVTGNRRTESWRHKSQPADFHELSTAVEKVLQAFQVTGCQTTEATDVALAWGLEYTRQQKTLGRAGAVKPELLEAFEIEQPVFYAELDWSLLIELFETRRAYQPVSRYPEVRRDLSLVMNKQVSFNAVKTLSEKTERKLLKSINVFDIYEGQNLGEGKKSYSVSFILQDAKGTLTDKQIDKTMKRLMQAFERELDILIRQ